MGVALYLLISGDILYLGLCLVSAGVVAATWRPRSGRVLAWGGLILALVSAVPIHPVAYAILLSTGAAWQASQTWNAKLKHAMAAALLVVLASLLGMALADRHSSCTNLPKDRTVFVIGDSLSAGFSASKDGTWPQLLSVELNLRVSNLAQAGATLADGASQARFLPRGPAIVLPGHASDGLHLSAEGHSWLAGRVGRMWNGV